MPKFTCTTALMAGAEFARQLAKPGSPIPQNAGDERTGMICYARDNISSLLNEARGSLFT
jgi:hypothetical protein